MIWKTAAVAVGEGLLVLILPLVLMSVINRMKARFAGRTGPPWLQPFYDVIKLLRKGSVYSRTTTWVFRAGPVISLAALATAATMVPVVSNRCLLGFQGDVIVVVYLLALARMFTMLAALDTGSSFEGMGAAREATFGMMAEPALFMSMLVLILSTGSLQLGTMVGAGLSAEWATVGSAMVLTSAALLIVLLTESCRIPVDDPNTHLELTMIHEVMVLDHSGPDLAFITYGAALKFTLLGSFLVHSIFPHPDWALHLLIPLRVCEFIALALVVGVIESTMARLRLVKIPQLLAGATVLSGLAVVLVLSRRGA